MNAMLDTSAVIYLNDFSKFEKLLTVSSVVEEIKDDSSKMKLSGLAIKIVDPAPESLKAVEEVAKGTGDIDILSKADIDVIAAAKDNGCVVISDDRAVQNVCEKMGIGYISIFNKKITKLINWRKYCKSCRKYSNSDECDTCGGRTSRVPFTSKILDSHVQE
jgi:UPF0271 protein